MRCSSSKPQAKLDVDVRFDQLSCQIPIHDGLSAQAEEETVEPHSMNFRYVLRVQPIIDHESGHSTLCRPVNVGKPHHTHHLIDQSSAAAKADRQMIMAILLTQIIH